MKQHDKDARLARMGHANDVLISISRHGRRFFHHGGKVTRFVMDDRDRLWLEDKYTGMLIWMRGSHRWRHFSDGGTLRRLCEGLRDYVMTGKQIGRGHFGPWPEWMSDGDPWAYGIEAMTALRAEIRNSPAIDPGGRRGLTVDQAAAAMARNTRIIQKVIDPDMLRLVLSGHVTAFAETFHPQRRWPNEAENGSVDLDKAGYSALTPARTIEFRGWGEKVGPWSHFQPLQICRGDMLSVMERWSVASTMDGMTIGDRDVRPVGYAIDGSIDTCGSDCDDAGGAERHPGTMPMWASRLTLEVTGTDVMRLSRISAADLTRMGTSPDRRDAEWDRRHSGGPKASRDELVQVVRFDVLPMNVLDLLGKRAEEARREVPDNILSEDD